tara:strand:+ start:4845 stop:5027 length:183 start_codon:yes stop_codon:yes gene_type:complete
MVYSQADEHYAIRLAEATVTKLDKEQGDMLQKIIDGFDEHKHSKDDLLALCDMLLGDEEE